MILLFELNLANIDYSRNYKIDPANPNEMYLDSVSFQREIKTNNSVSLQTLTVYEEDKGLFNVKWKGYTLFTNPIRADHLLDTIDMIHIKVDNNGTHIE